MSKWFLGLAAAALAAAPAAARDKDAADTAEAVVKKAIAAHGGAAALDRYKAGSFKIKGDMTVFDMNLDFTGDLVYQLPDKFRMTIDTEVGGQKLSILQVVNGERIKNSINGADAPLGDAEKAELRQAAVMQEVSQLTPLLGGKKYTIKLDKDAEVGGKPAKVVLVSGKDFKDTKLYFDQKSGLLVKTSRRGLAPSMGDERKEVTEESLMSDFQKVEGVLLPMKIAVNHDGKKFMAMTLSDAKLMEKADAGKFAVGD